MDSSPVRVERRAGQRFPYLLPVSLREISSGNEVLGFTQDVSSRGVFIFVDKPLQAGAAIEVTLNMPSEITLGESMRVRCRGHILRVEPAGHISTHLPLQSAFQTASAAAQPGSKIGVAIRLETYEYLTEPAEQPASFQRVSAMHSRPEEDRPVPVQPAAGPILS